jgi:hypothetical protein
MYACQTPASRETSSRGAERNPRDSCKTCSPDLSNRFPAASARRRTLPQTAASPKSDRRRRRAHRAPARPRSRLVDASPRARPPPFEQQDDRRRASMGISAS